MPRFQHSSAKVRNSSHARGSRAGVSLGAALTLRAACMLLAGLLSACAVSSYELQSETQYSEAPDMSEACSYEWHDGAPLYRYHAGWTQPGSGGALAYSEWSKFMEDLRAKCAGIVRPNAAEARIDAYFLQTYDLPQGAAARTAIAAPMMILNAASFGSVPFTVAASYAVCVEASSDGLLASALARGRLESTRNAWGRSREEQRKRVQNLTYDLTVQAWHKLWIAGQTLPRGTRCQAALDALYQGTE